MLDELRTLVLQGVEPRPDGLEKAPTADSLALAEKLLLSLPDGMALPSVGIPDDGEVTFSWRAVDNNGERWSAGLAVAPNMEVEGFVRSRTNNHTEAGFLVERGDDLLELPNEMVEALQRHWGGVCA